MSPHAGIKGFSAFFREVEPVRARKTRQVKNLEACFDSIETEKALVLLSHKATVSGICESIMEANPTEA
jgi:hypothetical protein